MAHVTTRVADKDGDAIEVSPAHDGQVYVTIEQGTAGCTVILDATGVTDLVCALQGTLNRSKRDRAK